MFVYLPKPHSNTICSGWPFTFVHQTHLLPLTLPLSQLHLIHQVSNRTTMQSRATTSRNQNQHYSLFKVMKLMKCSNVPCEVPALKAFKISLASSLNKDNKTLKCHFSQCHHTFVKPAHLYCIMWLLIKISLHSTKKKKRWESVEQKNTLWTTLGDFYRLFSIHSNNERSSSPLHKAHGLV